MNKTFSKIVDNVQAEVMDTSTAFETIVKEYVNSRYFQILRAINWNAIRNDYTFTTTGGTQEYVLPDDFGKELHVRDTTNGFELGYVDIQKLLTDYPDDFSEEGSVAKYYILEDTVQAQPTSASVIAVKSSSASDTTQTVLIRGIVSGVETSESVTVTGTTAANSVNSYSRVKAVSKSANTTGYITLTSNSAAVTVATLAPKILTGYYKKIGFFYVPSSAVTIAVPYYIKPLPMTEDYDYPLIDIADLIELGAKADAWRYKRQGAKANDVETRFAIELQGYIWNQENQPNRVTQFTPITFNQDNLY